MIEKILNSSFARPGLTLTLVLAGTALGAMWLQELRRDVFPDLAAPVFNIIVQNPAMGPEELETSIAIPMEAALAGLPDVKRIRSNSQLGVTQVTIEFQPEADFKSAVPGSASSVNSKISFSRPVRLEIKGASVPGGN